MKSTHLIRHASVALAAFTLACGDSTGLARLSEEQVGDMLDAMAAVAALEDIPGAPASFPALRLAPATANATFSISQTVSCPNGGSASVSGTVTDNEAGTVTAQLTHDFDDCAATSSEGRVWTFNGSPHIVDNLTATANEATGAFSMTASRVGGVQFASNLGSGVCQINLTFTMSGNADSFSGSISGSACGHSIQQSFQFTQ